MLENQTDQNENLKQYGSWTTKSNPKKLREIGFQAFFYSFCLKK